MQAGTAYDFDAFMPRTQNHAQNLRVTAASASTVKKRRGLSRFGRQTLKISSTALLLLALICSVLYSQTIVTELNAQILDGQNEMKMAKSENAYLINAMEMKTNLKTIEEYATAKLGLVKMEPAQIVYVDREAQNAIVCEESWWSRLVNSAQQNGMSFFQEYRRQ